uniref:Uncharacterized protein n=2 Tax=Spongospora subterranea TaxID=70186 RepID=A0A0H5QTJ5_9EUKA|eukprot:CRZ05245.1 hypothetical protein [Spongospora subterranea]
MILRSCCSGRSVNTGGGGWFSGDDSPPPYDGLRGSSSYPNTSARCAPPPSSSGFGGVGNFFSGMGLGGLLGYMMSNRQTTRQRHVYSAPADHDYNMSSGWGQQRSSSSRASESSTAPRTATAYASTSRR